MFRSGYREPVPRPSQVSSTPSKDRPEHQRGWHQVTLLSQRHCEAPSRSGSGKAVSPKFRFCEKELALVYFKMAHFLLPWLEDTGFVVVVVVVYLHHENLVQILDPHEDGYPPERSCLPPVHMEPLASYSHSPGFPTWSWIPQRQDAQMHLSVSLAGQ